VDVEPGSAFRLNFSEPVKDEDYTQLIEFFETDNPESKVSLRTS